MPDIALRFNKDMLVLSTSIDYQLQAQGFTAPGDREYVALCEPELVEECYKLEVVMDTPVYVTATEGITRARLAYSRFEGQAQDMAQAAWEAAQPYHPQHLLAAVGPTGLPLDPSMASSLKQSKKQYQDAVLTLMQHPFDGIYFSAFSNLTDAQCALMGARSVFDGPIFMMLAPSDDGALEDGESLADGVALCDEYGASVIGVSTAAPAIKVACFARVMAQATNKPLAVELLIKEVNPRQFDPTEENPYPRADTLLPLGCALQQEGVQFLRAAGNATPAYTGALIAAVMGSDVCIPEAGN